MLFFFKEKPINIIFKVSETFESVNKYNPIKSAKKYIPEWWKDVPSSKFYWEKDGEFYGHGHRTVKSCPGIISSLTSGAILPLWTEFAVRMINENFQVSIANGETRYDIHLSDQMPGFYPDYWYLKLGSPWLAETPVKLMYMSPFWLYTKPLPFISPYGIVTPIDGHAGTHSFMFFKKTPDEQDYLFKHGIPLLHIVPLTDKKVNFITEVVSDKEYQKAERRIMPVHDFVRMGLNAIRNL
jgi:hypothetical protein